MIQWINDSVSRRFSGSMNPCTSELVSRWTNETVNQWISDSLIQWTTEPMKQWIRGSFEPLDEGMDGWWMDERTNERTNEWMDPDRAANPRKQRPYFGDLRSHITQKNTGFHACECFHPWIHTLPNYYTSQLLDDGWLTWRCGWHDDGVDRMMGMVGMLTMTMVRKSEVFKLNFLW